MVIVSKPVLLYSLRHSRLSLKQPLAVSLEYEEDQVIAYAHDLDVFGYGENESEALDDLRRTVVDLYLELQEHSHDLADAARAIWRYLSQIVNDGEHKS